VRDLDTNRARHDMSARKRRATAAELEPEPEPADFDFDEGEQGFSRGSALPAECLDATIKLYVTHTEPNYSMPWQMRRQSSSTSTGFVISGNRILTNAHCVDNFAVVKVKKRHSATKFVAEVIAIGRECDLALLTVHDKEFWKATKPIVLADELPALQDVATVVGFPVGGDNLAITQGVVSRIDMQEYVHGCCELLAVQIDAAINPGNSGGPAFGGDANECVGVAFQSLKDGQTENIGYIIPTNVVNHFLTDVERHGQYTGFVELGLELQRCENPSLRAHAGMQSKHSGLLVKLVQPTSGAAAADVRVGDVLTHIDGEALANDGTVPFKEGGGRISFSYLLSQRYVNERSKIRLLRGGKELPPLDVNLRVHGLLVPEASSQRKQGLRCPDLRLPSYLIVGGFVFVTLCEPYLRAEYGEEFDAKAPIKLLDQWQYGIRESTEAQVVVLSQVLAHAANVGYEHLANQIVTHVNGVPLVSLKHLMALVEGNDKPMLRFELEPHNELVVLESGKIAETNRECLEQHSIPADRSADLRDGAGASSSEGNGAAAGAAKAKSARRQRR
jgi:S1-C subfamily serine protease